jgi:hypothetical protein
MADVIYPKGFNIFPPREGAPDFVKGKISIEPKQFVEFLKEHAEYRNAKGYYSFDLLEGNSGLYVKLDTYKAQANND